ncbi:hypothetical protein AYO39_00585 [Actinobacteria bacterium SCGC AG-212-D09]|nr:hypothetical protein AYO39_00585 [Actinobacteria bacterium SCGC AG-212-D09]
MLRWMGSHAGSFSIESIECRCCAGDHALELATSFVEGFELSLRLSQRSLQGGAGLVQKLVES